MRIDQLTYTLITPHLLAELIYLAINEPLEEASLVLRPHVELQMRLQPIYAMCVCVCVCMCVCVLCVCCACCVYCVCYLLSVVGHVFTCVFTSVLGFRFLGYSV